MKNFPVLETIATVALLAIALAVGCMFYPRAGSGDVAAWVQAVGAIGAIVGAFLVADRQLVAGRKLEEEREQHEIESMLYSIRDEIEIAWITYNERIRPYFSAIQPGEPLAFHWPLTDNNFPVFDGCRDKIGKIPDHELRQLIIITYARANGLIRSFIQNNEFLRQMQETEFQATQLQNGLYILKLEDIKSMMRRYGDSIRVLDKELEEAVTMLLSRLPEFRSASLDRLRQKV